jgi:hypothetical protein
LNVTLAEKEADDAEREVAKQGPYKPQVSDVSDDQLVSSCVEAEKRFGSQALMTRMWKSWALEGMLSEEIVKKKFANYTYKNMITKFY